MIVARAFLSLIPMSWKYARAAFSFSLHPLQISLFSFGFSGATSLVAVGVSNSLITENGAGGVVKEGNRGSVAILVVTDARRGRATVKNCCTSFN
jgi:hypothetical protein